ncbi:MAG: hypothetical protein AAFU59_14845 [Pseudomonadota bacterium]
MQRSRGATRQDVSSTAHSGGRSDVVADNALSEMQSAADLSAPTSRITALQRRADTRVLDHPSTATPLQAVRIKLLNGGKYTDRAIKKSDKVIETKFMTPKERAELLATLDESPTGANLIEAIKKEWKTLDGKTGLEELSELFDVEPEISKIEKNVAKGLTEQDKETLTILASKLRNAQELIRLEGETEQTSIYPPIIKTYLSRIEALDKSAIKSAEALTPDDLDLSVTAQEIADYREDMRENAVWGGLAEAEHIATTTLKFSTNIFVVGPTNRLRRVMTIGATRPRNGHNMDLVHLGDHYVAVTGAVDGGVYAEPAADRTTERDGNCLFEALQIIYTGSKMSANIRGYFIRYLRSGVTADANAMAPYLIGMSDQVIATSIMEMIISDQRHGVGSRMAGHLNRRRLANSTYGAQYAELGAVTGPQSKKLKQLWEKFEGSKAEGSGEARHAAYLEYATYFDSLPRRQANKVLDSDNYVDESGKVDESALRSSALKELKFVISGNNKEQYIINRDDGEYVIDRVGQLVPRFVIRNISPENLTELSKAKAIYPTNMSPVSGAQKAQVASGTGSNKITRPSDEMQHVQGTKPSDFLSATTYEEGALNPQGKPFTDKKGKAAVQVRIDLSYISPQHVSALYTGPGIAYYLLKNFGKTAQDKRTAVETARANKGSSEDLAKSHPELSAKEWQALLDVIRTTEVLISGEIPKAAITKK